MHNAMMYMYVRVALALSALTWGYRVSIAALNLLPRNDPRRLYMASRCKIGRERTRAAFGYPHDEALVQRLEAEIRAGG